LVASQLAEVKSGNNYNVGITSSKKHYILFPAGKQSDDRIMVMGNIPQPKHRQSGYIDTTRTNGGVIDESQGGGAWGSGSCFLALLSPGERVVSNKLIVWENKGGVLFKTKFDSLVEYELHYNPTDDVQYL
jgi:hypothetical protein